MFISKFFHQSFFYWTSVVSSSQGSLGCGRPFDPEESIGEIPSGGTNRSYRIYIPSSYDSTTPTPLILSYHGATENARDQEKQSNFSNPFVNPDMIAVYPQGLNVSFLSSSISTQSMIYLPE